MLHSRIPRFLPAAFFLLLVTVFAQIYKDLPVTPVPLSAALMAVFLTGALLDRKSVLLSLVAYVVLGFLGVPVFPGFEGGLHLLAGPSGGFLIAYPLIGVLISCMVEKWGRGFFRYFLYMLLALPIWYTVGTLQLLAITQADFKNGMMMAVTPFLLPDLLMCAAAAAIAAAVNLAYKRKDVKGVDNRSL